MVECQREDQVSESVEDKGADNVAVDLDDYSSVTSDEFDEDLTTDGITVAISSVKNEEKSNFGNISVTHSKDVHFGNKTFYQGPVTIVYTPGKDEECTTEDVFRSEFVPKDVIIPSYAYTQENSNKTNGEVKTADLKGFKDEPFNSPSSSCLKRRYVACMAASGVAVVLILTTIIVFLPTNGTNTITTIPRPVSSEDLPNIYNGAQTSGKLRLLPRNTWLAQPPNRNQIDPLTTPVPYVIISHTASEPCMTSATCIRRIRDIQVLHMEGNSWGDIGYNFLVAGDSYAYTGRSWDDIGAHSYGFNNCSIGIAFIGTFTTEHPPRQQMEAAKLLIAEGVRLGKIRPDYRLLGHRQVSSTESPGEALFNDLKKMPHFSERVVRCYGVIDDMDEALKLQQQNSILNSTSD